MKTAPVIDLKNSRCSVASTFGSPTSHTPTGRRERTVRIQKRMASGQLANGPEVPERFVGLLAKAIVDLLVASSGAPVVEPSEAIEPAASPTVSFNAGLYQRLADAAKRQELLAYGDLKKLLGLDMDNPNDRKRIGEMLGEISRYEVLEGRPMLSAVVWHKDMSGPGRGFFNLGTELGRVRGGEDELAFATRELDATYAVWATKERRLPMTSDAKGRELFIVDNSISGWTGLRYLDEWDGDRQSVRYRDRSSNSDPSSRWATAGSSSTRSGYSWART